MKRTPTLTQCFLKGQAQGRRVSLRASNGVQIMAYHMEQQGQAKLCRRYFIISGVIGRISIS